VTKNAAEVGARLELAWPVQRREARGKAAAARAAIRKVDEALRLTRDAIAAEVRDALSEIAAAGERAELAEAAYDAAHRLEEGERRKLELGQSDLLLVQIRESASAEAAREAIAAWADYHAARAWLSAATVGLGPVARELDQETERRRLSETPPAADGGAAPR
jgi:outer membrane protein TolC